jgi:ankyrin repeat protein
MCANGSTDSTSLAPACRLLAGVAIVLVTAAAPAIQEHLLRQTREGSLLNDLSRGDGDAIRELLRKGSLDPEGPRAGSDIPLCVAALTGEERLVRALLAAGADPNAADVRGTTALMYAAIRGESGTFRVLLDSGADPARRNAAGFTADEYLRSASAELPRLTPSP